MCRDVRDGIRDHLLDPLALDHLEGCGSINWNQLVQWQYRSAHGGEWAYINDSISGSSPCTHLHACYLVIGHLEEGYLSSQVEVQFSLFPQTYQINYTNWRMMNISTQELFEVRRLALAPLMPMKVPHYIATSLMPPLS